MIPDQILKALTRAGSSYTSVGRSLNPQVARQSGRDAVLLIKPSTCIMQAVSGTLGQPPAEVFSEKAYLFDQNNTGKVSQRSPSKGHSAQASGQPDQLGGHRCHPHATPLNHAPGTGCNVKMRGYK